MLSRKILISSILTVIALVSLTESLYWAYKSTRFQILNNISYLITAIIFVVSLIIWNKGKEWLNLKNYYDKNLYYLIIYSILVLFGTVFISPNDIVTILFNPFTLSPLVLLIIGFICGRVIYILKIEYSLLPIIRGILITTIGLSIVLTISPALNKLLPNIASRLIYISLLYFITPIKKIDIYLIVITLIIFVKTSIEADIRTNLIFLLLIAATGTISYLYKSKSWVKKISYLFGIILAVMFTFFSEYYLNIFAKELNTTAISSSNTRTFLFNEFFNSYKSIFSFDFIFGRGLMGTYFSEYFYLLYGTDFQGDFYNRFTIEVGFLEIILKFGLFYLIIVCAIIIKLILKKQKNIQYAITAIFCLYLLLFIEFYPNLSLRYLLFWLLIGYCSTNKTNIKKNYNATKEAR